MFSDFRTRLLRKWLLKAGRRMSIERMLERSAQRAVRIVKRAASVSVAYRTLLTESGVDAGAIGTDLSALPILSKENTFERFTLEQLSRPMRSAELADVLTSSGRGGLGFGFRLSSRKQHEAAWFDIDLGLQDTFGVDKRPTLLVNCLPMGVVFRSRAVTVANVSVREDMACAILKAVGRQFEQTLICTDPIFARRLLEHAKQIGVDWKSLNTSMILGEETLVESQREFIAAEMQIDLDRNSDRIVGSSFGVGELGLNLLFETRSTIQMRRALSSGRVAAELLGAEADITSTPSIFCFNPLRCHIEILNPRSDGFGELCFTLLDDEAVIPLPRYITGDFGKLVAPDAAARWAASAGTSSPWLPVVAVCGRIKDQATDFPSVEAIKELIYQDRQLAEKLSGAFRIDRGVDGVISLTLQASETCERPEGVDITRFAASVQKISRSSIAVKLLSSQAFPWRPALDYERKFKYLG